VTTPVDVNSIQAGDYELVAELYDQPAPGLKPSDPFDFTRYKKGDVVNLSVTEAKRLVTAGAVVKPGEAEKMRAQAMAASMQAHLAALPDEVRGEILATFQPPEPAAPADPQTPVEQQHNPAATPAARVKK